MTNVNELLIAYATPCVAVSIFTGLVGLYFAGSGAHGGEAVRAENTTARNNTSATRRAAHMITEVVIAALLADFLSGIIHLHGDYTQVEDSELYCRTATDVNDMRAFMATSTFQHAGELDKYLWDFQIHHVVPYPTAASQLEIALDLAKIFIPCTLVWAAAWRHKLMPAAVCRTWVITFLIGHFAQLTHHLTHIRNHASVHPVVEWLQDHHLILHPSVHRLHHETYDRNFCIVNGWTTPLVNIIADLLNATGTVRTAFFGLEWEAQCQRNATGTGL